MVVRIGVLASSPDRSLESWMLQWVQPLLVVMQTCHLEAYIRRRPTELSKTSSGTSSNTGTATVFAVVFESVEDAAGAGSVGDAHVARACATTVSKGSGVVGVRDKDPELGGCGGGVLESGDGRVGSVGGEDIFRVWGGRVALEVLDNQRRDTLASELRTIVGGAAFEFVYDLSGTLSVVVEAGKVQETSGEAETLADGCLEGTERCASVVDPLVLQVGHEHGRGLCRDRVSVLGCRAGLLDAAAQHVGEEAIGHGAGASLRGNMLSGVEHLGQVAELDIVDRLRDRNRHILYGRNVPEITKNENGLQTPFTQFKTRVCTCSIKLKARALTLISVER